MCGETLKPPDDFMWRARTQGTKDSYCRPCRAAYKQEHYAANKERYNEERSGYTAAIVLERTNWLLEYFEDHPCVDCGETDPVVLEFDHLRDKEFDIGSSDPRQELGPNPQRDGEV